jgi:hypothetical protein
MEGTPVLRVRLLSLDYAMTPRRPAVDGTVAAPELPVLRLVGATAAGQSVCLHVHQVFPYLFVPYPDPPTTAAEGACVCVCAGGRTRLRVKVALRLTRREAREIRMPCSAAPVCAAAPCP